MRTRQHHACAASTALSLCGRKPLTASWCSCSEKAGGKRYIIENVREGLDAPTEFYHDIARKEVLYVDDPQAPICGGGAADCVGIVPTVDNLISIAAANVTLSDLVIAHGGDGGDQVLYGYGGGEQTAKFSCRGFWMRILRCRPALL